VFLQIVPLGPAHDPLQEASPLLNPSVRPFVYLSGLALNRDVDAGSSTSTFVLGVALGLSGRVKL
jgi:hypothetical protein